MADSKMYAKSGGEWVPVYPEPDRGVAPVLSAAPDATQIVYTWTAATGITPASYELEFNGVIENVGAVLTFTKTGLTTGQTYTARVRAKTAENVRGPWSNQLSTVAAVPFNAATGGTETTVTNYNGTGETWKIHTFTGNGDFVVTKAAQPFSVLLVGGGGGGGGSSVMSTTVGGGGGGGALLYGTQGSAPNGTALTLAAGTYPVVIGAAGTAGSYAGNSGGDTTFNGLTAKGGGGGSGEWRRNGLAGGSGGGCWVGESTTGAGAGTAGQGTDGGYNTGGASGGSALHMPTTIRGTSETFGVGAAVSGWGSSQTMRGGGGIGVWQQANGQAGQPGIAVIAYRIA